MSMVQTKSWLESLSQHAGVQRLRKVLSESVAQPIWWTIPGEAPKALSYSDACKVCPFVRSSTAHRRICQERFLRALEQARRTKSAYQFICPIQRSAICLPVVSGGQTQGYLAMCNSQRVIPTETLALADLAVETAGQEMEKSKELKNLSEAIQPRCVALSTIHTIHRLISSTLNLEELLPRVARLCCQVLRVQSCAIWLLDEPKKLLVPRAVVNLQKGQVLSARSCRVGKGLVGAVASTYKSLLKERMMVVPLVEEECIGVIMVLRAAGGQPFGALDQEILTTLAEQAVVAIRNAQMYEAQERITWGTIKSLSAILEGMDASSSSTVSHRQLLADVALAIAQKLGLPASQQKPLQYAALLHDAGRVGIPEEIIRKPSKLDQLEFAVVKEHPVKGARFLEPLEVLEPAVPIILYHHERYDGTGYPKGLKKEAIPLGARILAVANAFEAMVCERPYRKAVSVLQAAREIASHAGTQFDPKVVGAFMALVKNKQLDRLVASSIRASHSTNGGT